MILFVRRQGGGAKVLHMPLFKKFWLIYAKILYNVDTDALL